MKPEELTQKIIELRAKAGPALTPIIDRCLVVVRELSAQTNDEVLTNFVAGLEAALPMPPPPPEGTIGGGLAVDEDDSPDARRAKRKATPLR